MTIRLNLIVGFVLLPFFIPLPAQAERLKRGTFGCTTLQVLESIYREGDDEVKLFQQRRLDGECFHLDAGDFVAVELETRNRVHQCVRPLHANMCVWMSRQL